MLFFSETKHLFEKFRLKDPSQNSILLEMKCRPPSWAIIRWSDQGPIRNLPKNKGKILYFTVKTYKCWRGCISKDKDLIPVHNPPKILYTRRCVDVELSIFPSIIWLVRPNEEDANMHIKLKASAFNSFRSKLSTLIKLRQNF